MYLQPLLDIHLSSHVTDQGYAVVGEQKYVYIFSIVAFFILFIACINFMNLFTARSMKRAKEIALRKVVGSKRVQLIKQFLTESLLFAFVSLFIALVLVHSFLPFSQNLLNKSLVLNLLNIKFNLQGNRLKTIFQLPLRSVRDSRAHFFEEGPGT